MIDQLPKLPRASLVDGVIAAIRKMLGDAGVPQGEKLPTEQELARQLGVGRSTIREALRVLGHLGLVESKAGLGTYVVRRDVPSGTVEQPLTPQGLKELFEFRHVIESPAARLAAERRTTAQMAKITTSWRDCADAVGCDDPTHFARLDYKFHLSIVEASDNPFMIQAYRTIEKPFADYVSLVLALGPLQSMLRFHDKLISAIQRHDVDSAGDGVDENFRDTDVRLILLGKTGVDGAKP